jgi:xanthine dehydrogenase YagS FAD-binding subunit
LKNEEIITDVQVPASKFAAQSTYLKFKERDSMDFAMSAVAAAVALGANKTVSEARIVLGGVAPIPWRVPKAEAAVTGKAMSNQLLVEVASIALQGAEPLAKNAYKIPLTQTLVRRALARVGGLNA